MGVLHTLGDRGIHWGKDIAVVGFDDSQVSQVVPGGLTSVRQPLEQVAVELVKALEGLLSTPPVTGPGVLLTPTLAVRLSSGSSRSEVLRPQVDRVVDRRCPSCSARIASASSAASNSMRTTASRSARLSKRQSRSSGVRVQPCAGPEALDGRPGRRPGSRAGTSGRTSTGSASLSITNAVPAAPYDAVELGEPGLAAGPEEVGPPGVHDVDRRVGQRDRLGGAGQHA